MFAFHDPTREITLVKHQIQFIKRALVKHLSYIDRLLDRGVVATMKDALGKLQVSSSSGDLAALQAALQQR